MSEKKQICMATVSYGNGWHFKACGKPAKSVRKGLDRETDYPVCGIHARAKYASLYRATGAKVVAGSELCDIVGRTDIVIPRPIGDDGRSAILRVLLAAWPDAVLEHAEGDDQPIELAKSEGDALTDEFLVYRNAAALHAWNEDGGTEDNADSMIQILVGPTTVTCVVDPSEGAETRAIAGRIERAYRGYGGKT